MNEDRWVASPGQSGSPTANRGCRHGRGCTTQAQQTDAMARATAPRLSQGHPSDLAANSSSFY